MNLLMVFFGLIAILAAVGTVQGFKQRNILSIIFNLATFVVFGAFVVLTIAFQGYPPKLH
ncbi:DUF2759 family protein [Bhargavaea cecembensis]|uniref:DUF2759 family protein n=1 Tax=Bhargavaea cecembensis TaxID=394098 RepID=UPI0005901503|nr:DUF2759 family protein [Bhargavaea cecembensis]